MKSILKTSQKVYGAILRFYPAAYRQEFGQEMQFVFSQTLKDAYEEYGEQGIVSVWARTMIDAGRSIVIQHLENQKRSDSMKTKHTDIIMDNKIFGKIALATVLLLLIPLALTIRDRGVGWNWGPGDFVIMGALIFGTASMFVLAARKVRGKTQRIALGIAFAFAFFLVWVELAVDAVSRLVAWLF